MDQVWLTVKEEAILFAKDKIEDAAQALQELMPDTSEELFWMREQLSKELMAVRGEILVERSGFYCEGEGA